MQNCIVSIEPINCHKYNIDGTFACSFVFAGNDDQNKRYGMLVVTVVDSKNTTQVIRFKSDPTNYDKEIPIMNHIINSYKLLNNIHVSNQTNTNYGTLMMGNNNLTNTTINKKDNMSSTFLNSTTIGNTNTNNKTNGNL